MRINEIFYSLQGEGFFVGTPAVFIRMAGCNMRCGFCDTDHSSFIEMTEEEIVKKVCEWPTRHVIITGGEPALQLTLSLLDLLHEAGKYVHVETNGTLRLPPTIDWITCSPKGERVVLGCVDELKVIYLPDGPLTEGIGDVTALRHFIQPCDTGSAEENEVILRKAIDYVLANPEWRLSLQTHKLIHIK
ncbi:MAG: radical SAM protein [Barnesiella sp.]|nr:radical SAM protein [Barnesiella sp.]